MSCRLFRCVVGIILGLCLYGCFLTSSDRMARHVHVGDAFILAVQETVLVDPVGLMIRFRDVLEDSRCPEGVQCIQAGRVVVRLGVMGPRDSEESVVDLGLGVDAQQEADYQSMTLHLDEVTPRPKAGKAIAKTEYRIRLIVNVSQ